MYITEALHRYMAFILEIYDYDMDDK